MLALWGNWGALSKFWQEQEAQHRGRYDISYPGWVNKLLNQLKNMLINSQETSRKNWEEHKGSEKLYNNGGCQNQRKGVY